MVTIAKYGLLRGSNLKLRVLHYMKITSAFVFCTDHADFYLKITSTFVFLYRSCGLLRHEQNVSNKIMAMDEFG